MDNIGQVPCCSALWSPSHLRNSRDHARTSQPQHPRPLHASPCPLFPQLRLALCCLWAPTTQHWFNATPGVLPAFVSPDVSAAAPPAKAQALRTWLRGEHEPAPGAEQGGYGGKDSCLHAADIPVWHRAAPCLQLGTSRAHLLLPHPCCLLPQSPSSHWPPSTVSFPWAASGAQAPFPLVPRETLTPCPWFQSQPCRRGSA